MYLGELDEARERVREGLDHAEVFGLAREGAELRAISAALWWLAEQPERAVAELDSSLENAGDDDARAVLLGQLAHLHFRLGNYEQGLADSAASLERAAGRPGMETVEARVLTNRALAHTYRSQYAAAMSDLRRALEIDEQVGADFLAAQVLHNLGFVATRAGAVPLALQCFDRAYEEYVRLDIPTHQMMVDRCELLHLARLVPEHRQAATETVERLEAAGLAADAAEARLSLAYACLSDDDAAAAVEAAGTAEAAFARQGRPEFAALAREAANRARRMHMTDHMSVYRSAASSVEMLAQAGWHAQALEVSILAARHALCSGRADLALDVLDKAGAPARGGSSPPGPQPDAEELGELERIRAMQAGALVLVARGESKMALHELEGVVEAARSYGLRLRHQSGSFGHGALVAEVARTALAVSLSAAGPSEVLHWAEQCRLDNPGMPGANGEPGDEPGARRMPGGRGTPVSDRLLGLLDGDCLAEFVVTDDRLRAVVAFAGRLDLIDLGDWRSVVRAVASLRFAIGGLLRRRTRAASRLEMAALLKRSARELDSTLVQPVLAPFLAASTSDGEAGRDAPGKRAVIVPAGDLYDLSWGMLPSMRTIPWLVCPSATSWCSFASGGAASSGEPGAVLLVAGPRLSSAEQEIDRVHAECYADRRVTVLRGPAATRSALLNGLERAEIAHLAVHGRFRSDNPRMSSIELVDGDLSAYELGAAGASLRCVVLSSCDSGRVSAYAAEELAGTVPALLGGRAAAVIASTAPLVDRAGASVSAALHRSLSQGRAPEQALCEARLASRAVCDLDDEEVARRGPPTDEALACSVLACHVGGREAPSTHATLLGESSA